MNNMSMPPRKYVEIEKQIKRTAILSLPLDILFITFSNQLSIPDSIFVKLH